MLSNLTSERPFDGLEDRIRSAPKLTPILIRDVPGLHASSNDEKGGKGART
jgi:hypothetical protein